MTDSPENDLKTISYKTAVRKAQDKKFNELVPQLELAVRSWLKSSTECPGLTEGNMNIRRMIASKFIEACNYHKGRK